MKHLTLTFVAFSLAVVACTLSTWLPECRADSSRAELQREARKALVELYKTAPGAKALGSHAAGILVFPDVIKAGFVVGGQYGDGVLFERGSITGVYSMASASFGLQAGIQRHGYALFFMTPADLAYLRSSSGWEIGVGPTVTIVDQGLAHSLSTTTARSGVYAFFFDQKGLMAGIGLQGTKITRSKS